MKQENHNVLLQREPQSFEFRKNTFRIVYHCYEDSDTHNAYTTTALDELNLSQIHNQYRQKYALPFPDEIRFLREQYGLSAAKMSKLLGFGGNQYRLYEDGEMPSVSNGKMIASLKNPDFFKALFEQATHEFTAVEASRIRKRAEECISLKKQPENQRYQFIFKPHAPYRCDTNGYASVDPEKIRQVILFFVNQLEGVVETKLNKLLFYADFFAYKTFGKGLTGLQYQAISYGPVPLHYATIYENLEGLQKDLQEFGSGYVGSVISSTDVFDNKLFNKEELSVLHTVANNFKHVSAVEISKISHNEDAWIANKDLRSVISYNHAFTLKGL